MTDKSAFLRSINLVFDAETPERIAHFQPTAKSVTLMQNLAGLKDDRAFFVTAPYGSGKSLTSTYILHLIQNRPEAKPTLKQISTRLEPISHEMAAFARKRARNPKLAGVVLAMEGYKENVGTALQDAAIVALRRLKLGRQARTIESLDASGPDGAVAVLAALREKARKAGCDRIVILWDEFGRHLERLVAAGRSDRIGDVQQIAEFVSRSAKLPMTFSGIMHQGLLNYAGSMSQSGLTVWRKVEGRFKPIEYVDDSKELYRLIARLIGDISFEVREPGARYCTGNGLKELGVFEQFTDEETDELIEAAYPLEPVTLYLLPRLAARAAQNERTLFGFIYTCEKEEMVSPADLFDFFAPAMRSDTGVGGTYRTLLETESAISKANNDLEIAALKTVSLLSLGLTGERTKATPKLLEEALSIGRTRTEVRRTISHLVKRKLLLKRKHAGEIAIWHGTDVDLRGRLAEEQAQFGEDFDVEDFLEREFPPPVWRPTQYNDENQLRRYLASHYVSPRSLDELAQRNLPTGSDGEVLYILCEEQEEIEASLLWVRKTKQADRTMFAIPASPVSFRDAAVEVACLERMQADERLLERDPLVANELQQMLDDSRAHLSRLIGQSILPRGSNIHWHYSGKPLDISTSSDLRRVLSRNLSRVFSKTPRFNNEMIVRHRPSPNIVNARKKLMLGILERYGEERLGLKGEFADASIFRTILFRSGLYFPDKSERWRFAQPEDLDESDPLAEVWQEFRKFFTEPAKTPKDLSGFLRKLQEPPYGVRFGVIPILFTAATKAFPSPLSIVRSNGEYVGDLLPSVVEDICRSPQGFLFSVLPIGDAEEKYLKMILKIFAPESDATSDKQDQIRACFDAIELWKHEAPPGALTSRLVSAEAQKLQVLLRRTVGPTELFFSLFPRLVGSDDLEEVSKLISTLQRELSSIDEVYRGRIARSVRNVLSSGVAESQTALVDTVMDWAGCFPDEFVEQLDDAKCRSLLKHIKGPRPLNQATFLNALVTVVAGKAPKHWDDEVILEFETLLQDMVNRIEAWALESQDGSFVQSTSLELARLVERRIGGLVTRLEQIAGQEAAQIILQTHIDAMQNKEEKRGKPQRSA